MLAQHPLTIVVSIDPWKRDRLLELLGRVQDPDIESNRLIPFSKIKSIHFARFVLLDPITAKKPSKLVFSTDYDGGENAHIEELIREAGQGLYAVFECCAEFSGNVKRYLETHKVPTTAFYNGHPGLSAEQIRYEENLRTLAVGYLANTDVIGSFRSLTASEIKQRVALFLKENGHLDPDWLYPVMTPLERLFFHRKALATFIAGTAAGIFTLVFLIVRVCKAAKLRVDVVTLGLFAAVGGVLYYYKRKLNKLEASDAENIVIPPSSAVTQLMRAENFQVQNQLTHLVEVKDGNFRLWLLKAVLGSIHFLARVYFNQGSLGSIPSIHFARWLTIDGGKRLLFFSNFDGSWESYLGDFVDKAATGLTAVWSNTVNFPRTYNLVQQGARDEQRFKEWARGLQIPSQVWYSAYKTLSVQNINNNFLIHAGLHREMNEAEAQEWLDRLFVSKA